MDSLEADPQGLRAGGGRFSNHVHTRLSLSGPGMRHVDDDVSNILCRILNHRPGRRSCGSFRSTGVAPTAEFFSSRPNQLTSTPKARKRLRNPGRDTPVRGRTWT